jgi:hypothetical protein
LLVYLSLVKCKATGFNAIRAKEKIVLKPN